MKNTLFLFALLILFSGCSPKVAKVMRSGKMQRTGEAFSQELPYEPYRSLMIVEGEIEGKSYRFLFDTGAPTVISPELRERLKLKAVGEITITDSQQKKRRTAFVKLPQIRLRGITFQDIGAVVADMRAVPELACMDIDGIIGANLMRTALWKIDPLKEEIHFGNSYEKLGFPTHDSTSVSFYTSPQGTPKVTVRIGKIAKQGVTFDTGYDGFFSDTNHLLDSVRRTYPDYQHVRGHGTASAGIFGVAVDTTTDVFVHNLGLFESDTTHKGAVSFERTGSTLLGMKFLRRFYVFMDWQTHRIHLLPHGDSLLSEISPSKSFGFSARHLGDSTIVSFVYQRTEAEAAGVEYGDKVISFNDTRTDSLSAADWCNLSLNRLFGQADEVNFVFEKKDGKQIEVHLRRQALFRFEERE